MQTTLIALVLVAIIAVSAYLYLNYQGQITGTSQVGTLKGTVSIGPLCPNVQNPPGCPNKPDFSQYKLVVTKENCSTGQIHNDLCTSIEVARVAINSDGTYSAILPEGTYSILIDPNVGIGIRMPTSFKIFAGQTTTLNLDFDTGIR